MLIKCLVNLQNLQQTIIIKNQSDQVYEKETNLKRKNSEKIKKNRTFLKLTKRIDQMLKL